MGKFRLWPSKNPVRITRLIQERGQKVINTSEIIRQHQVTGPTDTGSPEVQIALATHHIQRLTEHMKANRFDYHSRRGLMRFVSNRNKLLKYLHANHLERYREIIKKLEIRDKF